MINAGKLAVLGDKDSVLAFMALNVDVFSADTAAEANDILRRLTKGDYAVIFVTEDIAERISATLEILKQRTYPAVIPIPSSAGSNGYGMKSIKKDVEKAVGADVLFNKD